MRKNKPRMRGNKTDEKEREREERESGHLRKNTSLHSLTLSEHFSNPLSPSSYSLEIENQRERERFVFLAGPFHSFSSLTPSALILSRSEEKRGSGSHE